MGNPNVPRRVQKGYPHGSHIDIPRVITITRMITSARMTSARMTSALSGCHYRGVVDVRGVQAKYPLFKRVLAGVHGGWLTLATRCSRGVLRVRSWMSWMSSARITSARITSARITSARITSAYPGCQYRGCSGYPWCTPIWTPIWPVLAGMLRICPYTLYLMPYLRLRSRGAQGVCSGAHRSLRVDIRWVIMEVMCDHRVSGMGHIWGPQSGPYPKSGDLGDSKNTIFV